MWWNEIYLLLLFFFLKFEEIYFDVEMGKCQTMQTNTLKPTLRQKTPESYQGQALLYSSGRETSVKLPMPVYAKKHEH